MKQRTSITSPQWNPLSWWLLALVSFGTAPMLYGQKQDSPMVLDIHWLTTKASPVSKAEFNKVCANMGNSFLIGKGAWAYGIAKEHRCFWGKEKVSGKEIGGSFLLEFTVSEDQLNVSLSLNPDETGTSKTPPRKLANLALEKSKKINKALQDARVGRFLSAKLLDDAPMAGVVDIDSPGALMTPRIPKLRGAKNFAVYTLDWKKNPEFLVPKLVASISTKTKGKSIVMTIEGLDPMTDRRDLHFFQNMDGPGSLTLPLTKRLNSLLKPFGSRIIEENVLFDTLAGGFGGFRYGYPLTTGDPVVSKSAMVGIFTEVRGGPLQGLRWYWDFGPEVRAKNEVDEQLSFTWSRPSLGWALTFELLKTDLLTVEMDLTPKLGAMDLDAVLPTNDLSGTQGTAKFRIKNASSFGIDGGITWQTDWFLLRTWGASDLAGLLAVGDQSTEISSIRGGVDYFLDLFQMWDTFEFSLLVFGAAEKIAITRTNQEVVTDELGTNAGEVSAAINEVEYLTVFAGLGATVQW